MKDYYEARQYISLSSLAFDVIEHDKDEFMTKPSRQGFINLIIDSFAEDAQASIDVAVEREEERLPRELSAVPDSETKSAILSTLSEAYRKDLVQQISEYPKEQQFRFQLSERNYETRNQWTDVNGYYGGHPSRYYSALLEEYARKSYYEREAIALRGMINLIQMSIDTSKLLLLTLRGDATRKYEVRPYAVCPDANYNFHYLAGYSKTSKTDSPGKIVSFRLSRINSIEIRHSRSGKLTAEQRNEIQKKIETVGVQFLLHSPEFIRVKLTESGIRKYETQILMRPPVTIKQACGDGTWIYSFDCTPLQAEYYFFKFGADAEILAPEELRKRFLNGYLRAVDVYIS